MKWCWLKSEMEVNEFGDHILEIIASFSLFYNRFFFRRNEENRCDEEFLICFPSSNWKKERNSCHLISRNITYFQAKISRNGKIRFKNEWGIWKEKNHQNPFFSFWEWNFSKQIHHRCFREKSVSNKEKENFWIPNQEAIFCKLFEFCAKWFRITINSSN